MAGQIQPLDQQFAIVDAQGRPTLYFTKWAQQRQIDIGGGITEADLVAYLEAHHLSNVQEILDQISTTQGTILYRGAAAWSALAPGAAGLFLQTGGVGADPLWAAAGGGGGALTTLGKPDLSTTQSPSVNFYIMKLVLVDANFAVNKIAFQMSAAVPTAKYQPFVYASSAAGVPGALLGSGVQVTGAVAGYNEAPLSAPVNVLKGQLIWIGANVTTAALAGMWAQPGGLGAFAANGGSTVPANPSPGVTTFLTANGIYAFWAVT